MILVAADRWSATRFTDPFLLFCQTRAMQQPTTTCDRSWPRPIQVQFTDEIIHQLTTHPPRYIVAHDSAGTLEFNDQAESAPDLPALRAIIDSRYVPEAAFGRFTAYRRIER
jgi:hypothetical protein